MKSRKLAQTHNVIEATALIDDLLARPREEQRGLALIYGKTGLGKTAYAERLGFSRGWLYYRMKKEDTAKSFLQGLYLRLARAHWGGETVPRMSTASLEVAVTDILSEHPETVIVIDEINLATQFRRWGLVEIIRDLVDNTFATVIMVGEETTRSHLEAYNRHFFDRCGFFYLFEANTVADYSAFLAEVSDVKFEADLVAWLHRNTGGNLRQAGKLVESLEALARSKAKKSLTLADAKELE